MLIWNTVIRHGNAWIESGPADNFHLLCEVLGCHLVYSWRIAP